MCLTILNKFWIEIQRLGCFVSNIPKPINPCQILWKAPCEIYEVLIFAVLNFVIIINHLLEKLPRIRD